MKAPKIIELHDRNTKATARVATGLGFNCYSFRPCFDGEHIEALWAAPDFERGTGKPSSSGIPLLFPFPGRIARSELMWREQRYPLEPNDGRGNAIHGFVYTRPWRVIKHDAHHVVGQFQASVDDPQVLGLWPADFCVTAQYELRGNTLRSEFLIENPDSKPLPYGFGTHPYFRVPLGGEDAAECRVTLPVSEEWELADLIPTGERKPLRDAEMFQHGLLFGDMQFDNVFDGLVFDSRGICRSTVYDPSSQRTLTLSFDRAYRACVVYTPSHREAICIEPYTCVPNAAELEDAEIDAGLRVLEPGAQTRTVIEIRVE
jgi:aldose 1-epimerase